MNIPILIETALSIITVIILLSIISSAVLELFGRYNRGRSKLLRKALNKALIDPGLKKNYAELLYDHQQIKSFHRTRLDMPSYIAPKTFATSLIEVVNNEFEVEKLEFDSEKQEYILNPEIENASALEKYQQATKELNHGQLATLLKSFSESASDVKELKENIIEWYDDYMDRIGGWYKRSIQKQLFFLGLLVAIVLNVDIINVSTEIYQNAEIRNELLAIGTALHKDFLTAEGPEQDSSKTNMELVQKVSKNAELLLDSGLPIGWNFKLLENDEKRMLDVLREPFEKRNFLVVLLGWILAAATVTRGAPFWFNLFGNLLNLRSTGKVNSKKN